MRPALTAGLATVIRDRLLVDPRTFGFADADIPRCTCDDECNSFGAGPIPYPGRRHRCHFYTPGESCGECWLQLEADRISMRPEGLEIVLAEDTDDVQWSIFDGTPGGSYLCRPTRLPIVGYGSRPMPGALPFPSIAPPPPPPPPTEPPTCPLAGL